MKTAKELIKEYNIVKMGDKLCIKNVALAKANNAVEELKERKAEIMEELVVVENAKKQVFEERKRKISEIEGLTEIKSAISDLAAWRREFDKSFEDVGGMGVRPRPNYDISAMRKKFPRADAYLKAEAEANKNNYRLSSIGRKALERIINEPDDYENAIKQMNKEIHEFSQEHLFD